jgi:hypothetical protein
MHRPDGRIETGHGLVITELEAKLSRICAWRKYGTASDGSRTPTTRCRRSMPPDVLPFSFAVRIAKTGH